jgi:hypothetical protein
MKLYEEPQFDEDEKTLKRDILSNEARSLKLELPLKEGVLKINCGIPIILVVNKSDVVLNNVERKRFEEDSEFIIKHIRDLAIGCKLYLFRYGNLILNRRSVNYIHIP